MKLRNLLSPLRNHRRARSKARSEIDAIQDPGETELVAPHLVGSDPDLGTLSSALPTVIPRPLQNWVSSGMRTAASQAIYLTVLPLNVDNRVSDPSGSVTTKDKRSEPLNRVISQSAATSEDKAESGWRSTAYASAKVVVDVVKESSDVFVPLKSAAGALTVILKHYDVWCISSASSMILTITPASKGQSTNDRIFDTSG